MNAVTILGIPESLMAKSRFLKPVLTKTADPHIVKPHEKKILTRWSQKPNARITGGLKRPGFGSVYDKLSLI